MLHSHHISNRCEISQLYPKIPWWERGFPGDLTHSLMFFCLLLMTTSWILEGGPIWIFKFKLLTFLATILMPLLPLQHLNMNTCPNFKWMRFTCHFFLERLMFTWKSLSICSWCFWDYQCLLSIELYTGRWNSEELCIYVKARLR